MKEISFDESKTKTANKRKLDLNTAINTSRNKEKKDVEVINTQRNRKLSLNDLVLANKEEEESIRERARNNIIRSHKNDPEMIANILQRCKIKHHRKIVIRIIFIKSFGYWIICLLKH